MIRESNDVGVGGGRFSIDFPGIWMVTADDDGEREELEAAMEQPAEFTGPLDVAVAVTRSDGELACFSFSAHTAMQIISFSLHQHIMEYLQTRNDHQIEVRCSAWVTWSSPSLILY